MQNCAHWFRLALPVAAFLLFSQPAYAEPAFMGLGDLSGGSVDSQALGISADGSTVVGSSTSASGTEAFRWQDLNDNGLNRPGMRAGAGTLTPRRVRNAQIAAVVRYTLIVRPVDRQYMHGLRRRTVCGIGERGPTQTGNGGDGPGVVAGHPMRHEASVGMSNEIDL